MKPISKHHISKEEMEEEYRIIERAKEDIAFFEPLYNKYYKEIKGCVENTLYVNYGIKNEELTKDITASVFENAMLKLSQYKYIRGTPFKSWLYRIMQNEIMGYIRKSAMREKHQKQLQQINPQYDEIAWMNNFNSSQDWKLNYLKKYIPRLNKNDQLLIQYRFFNEYSYKEISKMTGDTENSLRTRMSRILKKIQNYIQSL